MSIIGIYGGSFNPPHLGHKKLVQSFLEHSPIDACWIFPASDPPHKNDQSVIPFHHRLEMCNRMWDGIDRCKVSALESEIEGPNYTLKTIQELKKSYPLHQWALCLGSDSAKSLPTWYESEQLIDLVYKVIIAIRPDQYIKDSELAFLKGKAHIVSDHTPAHYSSTSIRGLLANGRVKNEVLQKEGLIPEIITYIDQKKLYRVI